VIGLHIFGRTQRRPAGRNAAAATLAVPIPAPPDQEEPRAGERPRIPRIFLEEEPTWELPIGYALGAAALAWIVQAIVLRWVSTDAVAAVIQPLSGLVAGLLMGKRRRDWVPVLLCVAIAATIGQAFTSGHAAGRWTTATVLSAAACLESVILAVLLPRFENLRDWLRTPKLIPRYLFVACLAAPVPAALLSAAYFHLVLHSSFGHTFGQWTLADALGSICTVPLILALRTPGPWPLKRPLPMPRSIMLLGGVAALTVAVFLQPGSSLLFVLFPAVLMATYCCGFGGGMFAVELVIGIAACLTVHPRSGATPTHSLEPQVLFLQIFLGLLAVCAFASAAVFADRRDVAARYRTLQRQQKLLTEATKEVIVETDIDGICQYVSPSSRAVLSYDASELEGRPFEYSVHIDDEENCVKTLSDIHLSLEKEAVLVYRSHNRNGSSSWIEAKVRARTDEHGDVIGSLLCLRDISEEKRLRSELAELCAKLENERSFDSLTNVPTRQRFEAIFEQEWRRAARDLQPMAMLMIGVDELDDLWEQQGDPAVGECLRRVAEALTDHAQRPGDLVTRYTEDEFIVLMPATELEGACELADQIRRTVEHLSIELEGSIVSVSIGAAAATPRPGTAPITLLHDAERALHVARVNGGNRVESKPGPRVVPRSNLTFA